MRIGIDVGGTHTDAVILDAEELVSSNKTLTTADVFSGVRDSLDAVMSKAGITVEQIQSVMIGTTQFTNAVIQRRELAECAAIRIGLPSGQGIPPMLDWPDDIAAALGRHHYLVHGGTLYDGHELAALDDAEIDAAIADIKGRNLTNIAISAVFAPLNRAPEEYVAKRLRQAIPHANITLSYEFGRLGLIERENASILNAALLPLATRVVSSFLSAVQDRGLHCPIFVSQNDGTLMSADFVKRYPALTFASGPTNSLRGACKLSGLEDAIVIDIGGTTSDIGVLQRGFPRESGVVVNVGGVRTNFRMPDVLAIGLGGGSLVMDEGRSIGPVSVGHELQTRSRVFGGNTLTATDILVAAGQSNIGQAELVKGLEQATILNAQNIMHSMLNRAVETMQADDNAIPVVLVGGGAILVTEELQAASKTIRPEHAEVANAIGAAIAQIGGEAERLVSYAQLSREAAIEQLTAEATRRACMAGADRASIRVADVEETAVAYMEAGTTRLRVKVVGDIANSGKQAE